MFPTNHADREITCISLASSPPLPWKSGPISRSEGSAVDVDLDTDVPVDDDVTIVRFRLRDACLA